MLETIDNLWWTGRFDAYAGITGGFSAFCQVDGRKPNVSGQGLSALLHGASLLPRDPGPGLAVRPVPPHVPTAWVHTGN